MDFSISHRQSTLKHYKVLLINDNFEEVAFIRRALARSAHTRFEVQHAEWMRTALEALRTEHFDVVLADLFLPDCSGVEVVTELYEQEPDLPIVAMAKSGSERISSEVMRAGAEDYFQIEPELVGESNLLARVVHRAIERRALTNRLNFLHHATDMLSSSLDLDATVQVIEALTVPRLADCCVLEYLDGLGKPARTALCGTRAWDDPIQGGEGHRTAAFAAHASDQYLSWSPVVPRVLSRGEAELFENIDEQTLQVFSHTPEHYEKLQALGIKSMVIAPLISGGNQVGSLTFVALLGRRDYRTDDLSLVEEFSRRCAVALDNAILYEKVERALEAQEELLARVSHDLRTPLTSIRAGLGMLAMNADGKLSPNEVSLLNNAKRGAERLSLLVNDLLTYNEMSRAAQLLEKEPFDLRAVIEDTVLLIRPLSEGKGQRIEAHLPESLPYVGSGKLISQALTNLLDNAHMHTPQGAKIAISSRVTPDEVMLMISDDGPGIPPELHGAIFERFYKAPSARRGRGLGLGLAIARNVVELHGGRLWVESAPGEGTTFFISLPRPTGEEAGVPQTTLASGEDC